MASNNFSLRKLQGELINIAYYKINILTNYNDCISVSNSIPVSLKPRRSPLSI